MKYILSSKPFWLALIVFLLNIPLMMIESQIEERSEQRRFAKSKISESWTGPQELIGTFVVIPYQVKSERLVKSKDNFEERVKEIEWIDKTLFLVPEELTINSTLNTQLLKKGIYEIPVYTGDFNIYSSFNLSEYEALKARKDVSFTRPAYLSLGVKDSRGIVGKPEVLLQQKALELSAGSGLHFYADGFKADLSSSLANSNQLSFDIDLKLNGMESIKFITSGNTSRVSLTSDWPHPSFTGAFLPQSRKINRDGYSSTWETGTFSTNFSYKLKKCLSESCFDLLSSGYGVVNIQPVDIYVQSLRSVKYGLLIILVTFGFFFLYEVVSNSMTIHPVAYGLIGVSLAIFFLLLIALSEHIDFGLSYILASMGCTGLISFYVRHQSHSVKKGGMVGILLSLVYLILYFIIRSEDFAFLSGSILSFSLLAATLFFTRKIDWYNAFQPSNSQQDFTKSS